MTGPHAAIETRPILIPVGDVSVNADLTLPKNIRGLVIFAHGSGSSRHSSRNQFVAHRLVDGGFATVLLDLLTLEEERVDQRTHHLRFDVEFLAERLVAATDWTAARVELARLPAGYFGASTGAAAALIAAAARTDRIRAVVSRGGRPDLAGPSLGKVRAPTLLIVGGHDVDVLRLNQHAKALIGAQVVLEIVPGASHLFEEPGTLEQVATLASDWFDRHLVIH